jgi:hypothetical protein
MPLLEKRPFRNDRTFFFESIPQNGSNVTSLRVGTSVPLRCRGDATLRSLSSNIEVLVFFT